MIDMKEPMQKEVTSNSAIDDITSSIKNTNAGIYELKIRLENMLERIDPANREENDSMEKNSTDLIERGSFRKLDDEIKNYTNILGECHELLSTVEKYM